MRLLAIDTATERCSVALRLDGEVIERSDDTPRAAADVVLPMVESVLRESGLRLRDLDGIAYGRGPAVSPAFESRWASCKGWPSASG